MTAKILDFPRKRATFILLCQRDHKRHTTDPTMRTITTRTEVTVQWLCGHCNQWHTLRTEQR